MRCCLLSCIIILLNATGICQKPKQRAGLYTSYLLIGSIPTQGDKGTSTRSKFLLGVEYGRVLNNWLWVYGGFEYADRYVDRSINQRDPTLHGHVPFISMPVYLRTDVAKWLFFTFGTILDVKLKSNIVQGTPLPGLTGGMGIQFNRKQFGLFFHPYYQFHFFTGGEPYIFNMDLRIGASYKF